MLLPISITDKHEIKASGLISEIKAVVENETLTTEEFTNIDFDDLGKK